MSENGIINVDDDPSIKWFLLAKDVCGEYLNLYKDSSFIEIQYAYQNILDDMTAGKVFDYRPGIGCGVAINTTNLVFVKIVRE